MFFLLKEHNGMNNVGEAVEVVSAAGTTAKLCAAYTSAGAIASGSAKVEYVCLEGGLNGKTVAAGGKFLATPINADMVFETTASGEVAVNKAYQIASDGLSITATEATSGTGAIVVAIEGNKVRVKLKA